MSELTLPPSPNWYCTKIIDINDAGIFVFGARQDVHVLNTEVLPPVYLGVFGLHRDRISAVALSMHAGSTLCSSASEDGKVKVWDTGTKALHQEHAAHNGKATSITWSPVQEDLIVSGDDRGDLVVWQLHDNRIQTFCPEKAAIFTLSFSPFSSCVAVGYKTGVIVLVDVKNDGEILQRLRGHDEDVHCLIWCPIPGEEFTTKDAADFGSEGYLLASGSRDKTIRIWSTSKGRQLSLLKLPKPGGHFQRDQDTGRGKLWVNFVWPKSNPNQLISGSPSGELLLWDISKEGQQKPQPFSLHDRRLSHNRVVFNLCLGSSNTLCSISMDRQIIFWSVDKCIPVCSLPTLGGYTYVAKNSPVDPGRLAIGVGDCMIRIWNLNNKRNPFDVTCLWQGIKTKVTAISWHPTKEGLLAYGTEDGRVGIYDTLSNKPPHISSTYHRRTVYVVSWGPPCRSLETDKGPAYVVYSIGDGIILSHNPSKLHDEAMDVNTMIQDTNGQKQKLPIRSEISWNADFSLVAVGNDDGSIEIYRPPDMYRVCTIHVHKKLVNSISWHPHITTNSPVGSPYKHWISTGSNESNVHVIDLSSIIESDQSASSEPVMVSASKLSLGGHCGRITGVVWSPHIDGQLASVSYDGQARVWNVETGELLARYTGHDGKLLCVVWSGTDPDVLFTGADDFSLRKWKISTHPPTLEDNSQKRRNPKKRGKGKRQQEEPETAKVDDAAKDVVPEEVGGIVIAGEDKDNLESMIERKKEELAKNTISTDDKEQANQKTGINGSKDITESDNKENAQVGNYNLTNDLTQQSSVQTALKRIDPPTTSSADGQTVPPRFSKSDFAKEKKKKGWRVKSFFPVVNKFESRTRDFVLEDIVTLARCIYEQEDKTKNRKNCEPNKVNSDDDECEDDDDDDGDNTAHLGLFLDRRTMYKCLKQEGQYHRDHDNMDYYYQLEIWKGNINGALRLAREREELSDWLVAMAPMAAFDTWITICEDYATQLESDGQYHKAATYLLAAHKVYGAIELFKRHRLFKEAIAVAKVRLSPFDPVLEDLYMLWAHQLTKDGNYEQAAKCHLAMKQVQDAALLLARRYSQSSLQTATRISLIANEKQQALVYGQKVVQSNLLQSNWNEAYTFLKDQKHLQGLMAVAGMHELLIKEVVQYNPELISVEQDKFTKWEDKDKSVLPDFILDADVTDPVLPWQPHLIDGHTFPHHVLRIWYNNLGITMDTASIEEMYKALSVLLAGRQLQSDLQQLLVDVSIDLVLSMLSLLMSETPTAISHLLQAVSSLHDAEYSGVMEILLRRFLPQGPKYILKLQQEVTAMRVVISMESHSNFDGASKVHTIKRYLSELKEEDSVSNGGLRCRELDCLRAYYYLSILYFLRKRFPEGETTTLESSVNESEGLKVQVQGDQLENKTEVKQAENRNIGNNKNSQNELNLQRENGKPTCEPISEVSAEAERDISTSDSVTSQGDKSGLTADDQVSQNAENKSVDDSGVKDVNSGSSCDTVELTNQAPVSVSSSSKCDTNEILNQAEGNINAEDSALENLEAKNCDKINHEKLVTESGCKSNDSDMKDSYQLTITKLSHLARGLLWDIQGKRYALTETLGYIHKAISQLLLAQRPSSLSESAPAESSANERPQAVGGSYTSEPIPSDITEISSPLERLAFEDNFSGVEHSCKKRHHSEPFVPSSPISEPSHTHHHDHNCPTFLRSRSVEPTENHSFDIHIPHHGHLCVSAEDSDSNNGLFDLCSSCELITKSRKVLWEDEPRYPFDTSDHAKGKLTSIINPAKYINVPDEWYNMSAEQKYCMPYVTMAILKEEQEYIMHELKRGPDAIQVPFPNPMDSVKILLEICHICPLSSSDKDQFAEKVISWAMKFSVSSQQKDLLLEQLHKIQTHS